MANCPNCGSEHIQLKKDTNVDWGRAVAGWALFGVVGGAVGAVTGEDRNANACLDCGTSWKAADLYKTLQVINKLTGVNLDLAYEEDRDFINDFINDMSPHIKAVSEAEEKSKLIIKNSEGKLHENEATGMAIGCTITIFLLIGGVATGGVLVIIALIALFIGNIFGAQKDKKVKSSVEREIRKAKRQAEAIKIDAEENLRIKIEEFMKNHPL